MGGSIQRVDLDTGEVETLYTECDGAPAAGARTTSCSTPTAGSGSPTTARSREREEDRGAVYYARTDGSSITEAVFPLHAPTASASRPTATGCTSPRPTPVASGRGTSPAPGEVARAAPFGAGGTLVAGLPGYQLFDSLGVEEGGNVCVATLVVGGISVISPDGDVELVPLPDEFAEPLVTNICFGGDDLRTAYITLSGTGRLIACDWPRPGLPLAF